MLLFLVSFVDDPFVTGRLAATGEPIRLFRSLAAAEAASTAPDDAIPRGRIFVIDGGQIDTVDGDAPAANAIPVDVVLNRGPYRPPVAVEAGGGYVVRMQGDKLELLLIFRRGCWDLPKGKRDDDEDIEACALREVAEEVGIECDDLRILSDLGTTVHGYTLPQENAFAVKTTWWYAMTTTATSFSPQTAEGIEAVVWASWQDAGERLGFPNLNEHHARIYPNGLKNLIKNRFV